MPTIEAFIVEGHSHRQKEQLIDSLTHAVVESIAAPIDSVRVILNEVAARHVGVGGKPMGAADVPPGPAAPGAALAIMQVFLIAGRSDEQKVRLIAALTDAAVEVQAVARGDVRVIIKDIPNTDFGLAGKTAQSLGRGIDRAAMLR